MPEHRKNKRLVRLAVVDVAIRRDPVIGEPVQREYIFRHHRPDGHVPVTCVKINQCVGGGRRADSHAP